MPPGEVPEVPVAARGEVLPDLDDNDAVVAEAAIKRLLWPLLVVAVVDSSSSEDDSELVEEEEESESSESESS